MTVHCDTCCRYFSTPAYYKSHFRYRTNIRCQIALDKANGGGMTVRDILSKRKYSEMTDFQLHDYELGDKLDQIGDQLLGKIMGGSAGMKLDNEEMSDDDGGGGCPFGEEDTVNSTEDTGETENQEENEEESVVNEEESVAEDTDNSEEDAEDSGEETEYRTPNTKIYGNFKTYVEYANKNYHDLDPNDIAGIELLGIFANKRVPKCLYEEIVRWHNQHLTAAKMSTRADLLMRLETRYNMKLAKPIEQPLILPYSKSRIDVVCHDFKAQLQNLLSDPRIKDDNYLFFNNDPFCPPPEEWTHISDINTGRCYRETHHQLIKNPEEQVLLPIIFYMDGAVTGQFDNLPIEILKFTLGIFDNDTRNKPYAWRNLGFVRKFNKANTKAEDMIAESDHMDATYYVKKPEVDDNQATIIASVTDDSAQARRNPPKAAKVTRNGRRNMEEDEDDPDAEVEIIPACNAQDLHAMLDVFLETYKTIQDSGGILWDLHYRGKIRKVHFVPFIMFVKGDTVEHDKHCGRYLSRTRLIKCLCRYCCVKNEDTDKAYLKLKPKTQGMIEKMVEKGQEDKLKGISQQYFDNCWYQYSFGLHNNQGIHGACPVEIIHWFQLGKFKYGRTTFFTQLGMDSVVAEEFDALATLVGNMLNRQSDRTLPRVVFAKGIKAGKMQAGQMDGVILLLVASLRTTKGREMLLNEKRLKKKFGTPALIRDWIMLLETFLQWIKWMKLPEIRVFDIKRFKTKVREIMEMEKRIAPRTIGMKNKTFNFHAGLHVGDDMLNFGVPSVVNTESNESHHKGSKTAAMQTQRIPKTFDKACADNIHCMDVIDLAVYELKSGRTRYDYFKTDDEIFEDDNSIQGKVTESSSDNESISDSEDNEDTEDIVSLAKGSADGQVCEKMQKWVDFWIKPQNNAYTYRVRTRDEPKFVFDMQLVKFLGKILQKVKRELAILPIFTTYTRNDQIFRGTPNFLGKPWQDWVNIEWGNGWGIQPAHIWCFLDLRQLTKDYHVGDATIGQITIGPGVFAVVESAFQADEPQDLEGEDENGDLIYFEYSSIFQAYEKYVGKDTLDDGSVRRQFYLAPVDSFHSPVVMIPDVGNKNPAAYLKMLPQSEWSDQFIRWLGTPHQRDFTETQS